MSVHLHKCVARFVSDSWVSCLTSYGSPATVPPPCDYHRICGVPVIPIPV